MNVPKIRIKGFDGEWGLVPFSKMANLRRGLTYSPSSIRDHGVRVLRSCNIDEDTFVTSEDDVFVKNDCVNIQLAEDGDILITAANGSPRLVGKHCIVKNPNKEPMAHGGFMLLASSEDSEFLNASMGSSWFDDFKRIGIAGGNGAIGNLNKNELESFLFYVPASKLERSKIAEYFGQLDSLIEATGKKISSLKQTKQACLQQMFPAEGETTPRIRFKGFEGEWVDCAVKDVLRHEASALTQNQLGENNGAYPVYGASGYIQQIYSYAQSEDYIGVVKDGAGVGRINLYPAYSSVLGTLHYLKAVDNNDIHFLCNLLQTKDLSSFSTGSTIPHIYFKDYADMEISVPLADEQQQIAAFFSNMDKQIRIQEQRFEKLKQIKTACLENMFV